MLFKFIWRGKDRAVGSVPCSRVSPLSWTFGQERSKGDCWGERKKGEISWKNLIERFFILFILTSFFTFSFILTKEITEKSAFKHILSYHKITAYINFVNILPQIRFIPKA